MWKTRFNPPAAAAATCSSFFPTVCFSHFQPWFKWRLAARVQPRPIDWSLAGWIWMIAAQESILSLLCFCFFCPHPSCHPHPSCPRAALLQIHPYLIRVTISPPRPHPSLNLANLCVFISVSCSSSPGEERNNGAPASAS